MPRSLIERCAEALRERDRVAIRPEMHEEKARLLVEHVAVQRCDFDAVFTKRTNHGIDLGATKHKITGDRCLTAVGLGFVGSSFVMVLALSAAYVRFGGLPWMSGAFYG